MAPFHHHPAQLLGGLLRDRGQAGRDPLVDSRRRHIHLLGDLPVGLSKRLGNILPAPLDTVLLTALTSGGISAFFAIVTSRDY